ncbi:MAG TPA: sulfate ABC transporter permease subunit CysT [Actinomycetota bacterium]|nr:sulfate ABC transporter permease subunit CysT [Actinomycetota bacterium]
MSLEATPRGGLAIPTNPRTRSALPPARIGLRVAAILYLAALIAVPLVAVVTTGFRDGFGSLSSAFATLGARQAIQLTIVTSLAAAVINAFFGTLLAYVLVRFRFPGRGFVSSIVDLPFALPTLVTGVMLVALYGPASPIGAWLAAHGVHVIFAPLGILLALLFVTLPFVVRTVLPVLLELDTAEEEAARVLGAGSWTTFRKVVLPALRPAIVGGSLLVFARALGEFGALVVVSGNITGKTLTAPVFIFQLTSQFRQPEAAAVSTVLFAMAFTLVLVTDRILHRRAPLW